MAFVQRWAADRGLHPDPEQAAAIGAVHDNVLVTARAGSGKTSTLTARAAFLINRCGVAPEELLLLVFNRAAADEMKRRLKHMECEVPHAMTFHALAYAIVHPEEALLIDSPDD
ncbi:MAG: UvrD-helicase domain-containing protein, partial [Planctomyces sp.]